MKKLYKLFKNLSFLIFFAMFAGIIVGICMGEKASIFGPLGDLFIQLIKMLVVPLVFVSIISGASSLGATKSAGRIGFSALAYIFITTFLSVCLAFAAGMIFKPGSGISTEAIASFTKVGEAQVFEGQAGFWQTILNFIPSNPFESLTQGNILQIIVFGLFLGFGISTLSENKKTSLLGPLNSVLEALIWCITKIMWVAPIGVFGLMANATGTFGFDLLVKVANLLWVNILVVLIMGLLIYPLSIKIFSNIKLSLFFKAMLRPQIVAFSTASSMATLPINMEVCEKELGVSNSTSSFVIPLGATINMAGNAIYYTLVALFFAQFYSIELGMGQFLAIAFTASLGSIGQAGVPGPTLLVVAVLASAGIPLEGLPLFYALDRVFDMIRTVLNITGDAVCAVVVDPKKSS